VGIARLAGSIVFAATCALLALGAPARAQEARCLELGASCKSSEQYDTDRFTTGHCEGEPACFLNPTDANRTKQALGHGDHVFPADLYGFASAAGLELPPGIGHVLAVNGGRPIATAVFGSLGVTPATRRFCARWYVRYSADYLYKNAFGNGNPEANKFGQLSWYKDASQANGAEYHWDWKENNGAEQLTVQRFDCNQNGVMDDDGARCPIGHTEPALVIQRSGTLTQADLKREWGYAEMCVSGEIATGQDIWMEGTVRGIETDKHRTWPKTFTGDACPDTPGRSKCPPAPYFGAAMINTYRGAGTTKGTRYLTHFMTAAWDSDEGQRIGCAKEVEGAACPGASPAR